MTRIRFKGSPRSRICEQTGACGISAPHRSSPRNRANVGRCGGVSTHVSGNSTAIVPRTQRSATSAFTRVFDALWPLRSGALQSRAVTNSGVWYGPGSAERHEECRPASGTRLLRHLLRIGAGQFFPPRWDLMPMPLGGVIVAAGLIAYLALVIAVCGVIGAGEIFHGPGQVGLWIAQSFGRAGVAETACGSELDLHQPDVAMADKVWPVAAFAHDHPMHQCLRQVVGLGVGRDQRVVLRIVRQRALRKRQCRNGDEPCEGNEGFHQRWPWWAREWRDCNA